MKKIITTIIILFTTFSNCYASSDEIFEPDGIIPSLRPINPTIVEKMFNSQLSLDCMATPQITPSSINLDKIHLSNNLIRKQGAARRARGHYIQVIGKIVDEDCVPISNAAVQIWQTDSAGKYERQYKLASQWDQMDPDFDPNFNYSGTAQTNNLGHFAFLTILPISNEENTAPHINMTIKHPDFEPLTTIMYFNKHPRNEFDRKLKEISDDERELVTAKGTPLDPQNISEGRLYRHLITLEGINKYRRY